MAGPVEFAVVTEAFRTVDGRGEASFEIRGSTFVGHATPADTVQDAESFLASVAEEYDDATHNVPAYRVRADPFREYADDAGEPAGSAGKPALNVFQQEALENVAVVVTRYYGGTNLGVGGLARAYARATKEAIEVASVVERVPRDRFGVTVEYDDSGTVRSVLESAGVDLEATYDERVEFVVSAPEDAAAGLRDEIRSATSGRASIDGDADAGASDGERG